MIYYQTSSLRENWLLLCTTKQNMTNIGNLVEANLWELTDPQRNTIDNISCQTKDSNLGHINSYLFLELLGIVCNTFTKISD